MGSLERGSVAWLGDETSVHEEAGRSMVPPDLCRLACGDLLVSARDATNHTSIDGRIAVVRSRDGGTTWGEYQVVRGAADPPCDFRDPSICELSDGTLVLTFFIWRGKTHAGDWDGSRTVVMRSFDGGRSWPDERVLEPRPFDFMLTTERCIELPSGRLLMPVHGGSRAREVNNGAVWYSDDRGASWAWLSSIHTLPWPRGSGWSMETSIVPTRRGRLVAISRTNRRMLQAVSDDWGETWKEHRELADTPPETQPSLCCLQDGRLLLGYGDRGPLPRDLAYPYAVVGRLSGDEGRTWGPPLVIRDHLRHWDMGYPTTVEVAPGELLTVYWWSEPTGAGEWPHTQRYHLSCRRWRPPDF